MLRSVWIGELSPFTRVLTAAPQASEVQRERPEAVELVRNKKRRKVLVRVTLRSSFGGSHRPNGGCGADLFRVMFVGKVGRGQVRQARIQAQSRGAVDIVIYGHLWRLCCYVGRRNKMYLCVFLRVLPEGRLTPPTPRNTLREDTFLYLNCGVIIVKFSPAHAYRREHGTALMHPGPQMSGKSQPAQLDDNW